MQKEISERPYHYQEIDIAKALVTVVARWKFIFAFTSVVTIGVLVLGLFFVKTTFRGDATLSVGAIGTEPIETYNQILDTLVADKDVSIERSSNEKTLLLNVSGLTLQDTKKKTERIVKEILDRHAVILNQSLKEKNALLNAQIDRLKQSFEKIQKNLDTFQAVVYRLSSSNFTFEGQGLAIQGYLNALGDSVAKETLLQERLETLQDKLPILSQASRQAGEVVVLPIPPNKHIAILTTVAFVLSLFTASLWVLIKEWLRKNFLAIR